jgi:hypothetical protein
MTCLRELLLAPKGGVERTLSRRNVGDHQISVWADLYEEIEAPA